MNQSLNSIEANEDENPLPQPDLFLVKPPKKLIVKDEFLSDVLNKKNNALYYKFKELNLS
jgi:hypothetical protein